MNIKNDQSSFEATKNKPAYRRTSLLCKVCGDENARKCFGSISCAPCKMFFRRNLNFDLTSNKCDFFGNCLVNETTRHICRFCRYKKCLAVGMQTMLTRPSRGTQNKKKTKQINLPVIRPRDLLNNDRSKLSLDQWSLLSNTIHAYDRKSPLPIILSLLSRSSYPLKKRLTLDPVTLVEILGLIYRSIYTFLEVIPDFTVMSIHDQKLLIERNVHNAGSTSGLLILRDGDLYGNYAFLQANLVTYGSANVEDVANLLNRLDIDGTLVKLIIVVLAFSTCSDVMSPPTTRHASRFSRTAYFSHVSIIDMFHIQNKYLETMFIYMIYRYGNTEASIRFANLLFTVLKLCVLTTGASNIQEHGDMLDMVIEDTQRKLILEDQ